MTTQTIPPEAMSASDWQQLFARSPSDIGTDLSAHETSPETGQSFDYYDSAEISEIVGPIAMSVLMVDPDERLDYLRSVNPNLTEYHLDQIARTTEQWLDHEARNRIRTSAHHCYDSKSDPQNMLIEWDTTEDIPRLINLLFETSIPDKMLAMCYAMCAAYETAYAAFLIHENRAHQQTNFSNIEQTPEEIAGDLCFVNAE